MINSFTDTIVALATAQGVGAIAVIRLSGEQAIAICDEVFKGKSLLEVPSHTAHFGTIRKGYEIIDEVLVTVFKGPHSYTKENTVEISSHGSPFIIKKLLQLFIEKGARSARPGEFTQRAFLNGQLDLAQ
ncbi:tRNA uridine-5-carboxymethylaminomethyl(34) synthesis GTPase MnmE, partial [Cyclobacteriaceae bacterium]|nr:tRNA uridine-5-carboxymethylaminomethyl(34) synthesis GTPase MnmE [Cyclobacteriaceae bacterium]